MMKMAAATSNWWLAASSWQCAHSCATSRRVFCETSNHQVSQWPYSPDLVPCGYWLFPKQKSPLKGKRFQTIDEIQENTTRQLMVIPIKDFGECFEQWKRCWETCVRSHGHYVEVDWDFTVLCTMFFVYSIFFNKCLYFSHYTAGYCHYDLAG